MMQVTYRKNQTAIVVKYHEDSPVEFVEQGREFSDEEIAKFVDAEGREVDGWTCEQN